jgi:hypothetical protein
METNKLLYAATADSRNMKPFAHQMIQSIDLPGTCMGYLHDAI